jgi:hypothetical protein
MTFEGAMCFAAEGARDAAIDALVSASSGVLSKGRGLAVRHRAVVVASTFTAPAAVYEAVHMALWRVCPGAVAASVACTYEGDEPQQVVARSRATGKAPLRSAAVAWSRRAPSDAGDVLALYALADDSEEAGPNAASFVVGVVDPVRFPAYPAPDGLELPRVELAVKLNELLADDKLTANDRAGFEEALAWVEATGNPLYVARLERAADAGEGRA